MQRQKINSFVFFDCETTGLPNQERNTTRITELCFIAVQRAHLNLQSFPRVQNKLNLLFNPRKPIQQEAAKITELNNELLEQQAEFQDTVDLLRSFLDIQRKPVCLVAHNGNKFDYPILRAEINRAKTEFPNDILCVDSLAAFRDLHEGPKGSGLRFRLWDCYCRLIGTEPKDSHKAEADVNMLVECAAKLGEEFVDWADEHSVALSTIPMMEPGRIIGE